METTGRSVLSSPRLEQLGNGDLHHHHLHHPHHHHHIHNRHNDHQFHHIHDNQQFTHNATFEKKSWLYDNQHILIGHHLCQSDFHHQHIQHQNIHQYHHDNYQHQSRHDVACNSSEYLGNSIGVICQESTVSVIVIIFIVIITIINY